MYSKNVWLNYELEFLIEIKMIKTTVIKYTHCLMKQLYNKQYSNIYFQVLDYNCKV